MDLRFLLLACLACTPITATPGMDDGGVEQASWEVCWPNAPASCEGSVFQYPCEGAVASIPYSRCHSDRGGGLVSLLYSAEVPFNDCDLEGRIQETWESLSRGLEQGGCGDE
jgi:hypothetical protein